MTLFRRLMCGAESVWSTVEIVHSSTEDSNILTCVNGVRSEWSMVEIVHFTTGDSNILTCVKWEVHAVLLDRRLEVGTESALDRSKSIKTFLMPLFSEAGNHDVEVITTLL